MKIVYLGIYSRGAAYPRNRNIIHALRYRGHEVSEIHYEMAGSFKERTEAVSGFLGAVKFFVSLVWSYLILSYRYLVSGSHDVVVVGHPGYFHIHLTRVLIFLKGHGPLLVYDSFIPLYNAVVEDRRIIAKYSVKSKILHALEASCCKQAEINLVDTNQHGQYISTEFCVDQNTIVRVFVGSTLPQRAREFDTTLENRKFGIVFVGTYIPLHGIGTILKAAEKLLPRSDIEFTLVGGGQLKDEMKSYALRHHLDNVRFIDWIDTEDLAGFMQEFDLALGVFGSTEKTQRVIATKIFDICAVGLPFITSDSPAIREAFEHEVSCYLVPNGDFRALANAIEHIRDEPDLRGRLARAAAEIYQTKLCPNSICDPLLSKIEAIRTSGDQSRV